MTRCNAGVERPIQVSQGGGHGAAGARCGCKEEDRPHLFTVGEFLDKVVRPIYEDTHGRVRNVRASRFLPPASAALLCSSPGCDPHGPQLHLRRSLCCAVPPPAEAAATTAATTATTTAAGRWARLALPAARLCCSPVLLSRV